ncbi:MAG: PilZ domain-containing protein [Candidatus Acidiferrales bacterium]
MSVDKLLSHHSVAAGQRFPDVRKAPRYPISAPTHAVEPLSGREISGWVSIISRSGCYFRTADIQQAETVLQLRIEWHESTFETWARTVHAITEDGMGIAFIDTDPAQMRTLLGWIEDLAKQVPQ